MIGRVLSVKAGTCLVLLDGKEILCSLRGQLRREDRKEKHPCVVGDLVEVDENAISRVLPRKSSFARVDALGREPQLIAANVDLLFIVSSIVSPAFKPSLIDRFCIQAIRGNIQPIILINKIDLLKENSEESELLAQFLKEYGALGFEIYTISALEEIHLNEVKMRMQQKGSLFSGQSGTGKSTLLNKLLGLHLKTDELRMKSQKGRHVTSSSDLFFLKEGGFCIDTPGIRSFAIPNFTFLDLKSYFTEFLAYECKFHDCTHMHEPGCGVRGNISPLRFQSYQSLLGELHGKDQRYMGD